MATQVSSRLLTSFKNISRATGISCIVLGCLVLAGWQFDISALKSVVPGLATMKANTAIAFILVGASLWLRGHERSNQKIYIAAQACAGFAALLSILTLGEYISGLDFGIDQLLYRDLQTIEASFPGRMSLATAFNFAMLSVALLVLDAEIRGNFRPAQFLALTAGAVAAIALLGYLYGVDTLYNVRAYSSMALHTALGLALLSLGILCARPQKGFMEIAITETVGGIVLRRLMPLTILILVVLGWLRLQGQQAGFYDTNFGVAFMVLLSAASLSVVLWLNAGRLNRVDAERGQAERALSLTEQRSRALIESSWDAVALFGADGTILYGSPSTVQILGYSLDEFVGRNAFELIHEEDHPFVTECLTISLQQPGAQVPVHSRVRHKNGEWRWLEGVFTNLLDEPGVRAIVNNYHDFTERKQAEADLYKSEELLRLGYDTAKLGIWQNNLVTGTVHFDERARAQYGFDADNVTLAEVIARIHPDDVDRLGKEIASATDPAGDGRYGTEYRVIHPDGSVHWLAIQARVYFQGAGHSRRPVTGFGTSQDITERRKAEAEIRELNEELNERVIERTAALSQANSLLEMMLENMPDQIYFKDAQSRFIRNSRSQARALGLNDPAEAIGKSDFDFFPHAQLYYEKEQEIIRSGKSMVDEEERVVWPDGRETWVSTTKVPLPDQAGQIIGTFGISRDITERKRAEAELQKAKQELEAANKELEAFSYSVSHDLRSPLRSIDGFSQALLEDYADQLPAKGQDHLKRVRAATQRMGQLIDDLLNLSRVSRAIMKSGPVDLSELAQGIAGELQRTQPERRVNFSITPNLKAHGDPNLLRVVLENLLNNAWKFTSKLEQAEIEIGSKDENDETIYFIRDNGAGFDMAYVDKLFRAFQRLHYMSEFSGTGIGLATVQRIINRHGGRIWAEGAVDQGAIFLFTLPALDRAKPGTQPQEIESLAGRVKEII
ncbi:MAG TPA: PAS domain S-box protein [Anaerolineales bacterium]|nr:PAS domain S-box protein [Anaerolineales bacterium]